MVTPTSDCPQVVPLQEGLGILTLMPLGTIAFDGEFPRRLAPSVEPLRRKWLDAMPTHQPTGAECYGCVDWFRY